MPSDWFQGTAWIYWNDVPLEAIELHLREHEAIYAFPSSEHSTLIGANWSIERFRTARRDIETSYFDLLRRAAPELAERVEMATFAPPAPEMLALYTALRDNQEDTDAFFGLITEAVSPIQFFAPENVNRILGRSASHGNGASSNA